MMMEYHFTEGDTVTNIIKDEFVDPIRIEFDGNCTGCAASLADELISDQSVICSCVTFKNGSAFADTGVVVRDELAGEDKIYTHHTVLLFGECIMDILHSDRLVATAEYVKSLQEKNPKLLVDDTMTGSWINTSGWPIKITLERLLSGNWD